MERLMPSNRRKRLVDAIVPSVLSITLQGCFKDGESSPGVASPQTMNSGTLSLDHTSGQSSGIALLNDRFWINIDLSGGTYTYQHVITYPTENSGTVSCRYAKTDEVKGELLLSFSGGDLSGVSETLHLTWNSRFGGESWSLSTALGRGNFHCY